MSQDIDTIRQGLEASLYIRECGDHPDHLGFAEDRARAALPALDRLTGRLRTLEQALRPFRLMVETFETTENGGLYFGAGLDRLHDQTWLNLRAHLTEDILAAARAVVVVGRADPQEQDAGVAQSASCESSGGEQG